MDLKPYESEYHECSEAPTQVCKSRSMEVNKRSTTARRTESSGNRLRTISVCSKVLITLPPLALRTGDVSSLQKQSLANWVVLTG